MTVRLKRSMTWADDGVVVCMAGSSSSGKPTPDQTGPAGRVESGSIAEDDFRPDPAVGVNLQQQRVAQPAVDDVRLADAGAQALQAGLDLGDHPLVDHAALDQLAAAARVQAALQRGRLAAVQQDSRRVREQDQLL